MYSVWDMLCELGLFSFLLRIKFDVAKQGPDCVLLAGYC